MSPRVWVYNTLLNHAPLQALIGDRVFLKNTMSSSREDYPYIVYKLGYNANENFSEQLQISRQFLQIFIHDFADYETASYDKIDEVIQVLKNLFFQASSPADGVIAVSYVETSQDLDDQTLSTTMKYIRFIMTVKEVSDDGS